MAYDKLDSFEVTIYCSSSCNCLETLSYPVVRRYSIHSDAVVKVAPFLDYIMC